jgi:hypothetical protein
MVEGAIGYTAESLNNSVDGSFHKIQGYRASRLLENLPAGYIVTITVI